MSALVEEALAALIAGDAAIAALAQSKTPYPALLPEDAALPAMTYRRISGVRPAVLNGGGSHIVRARFELEAQANSYMAAKQLAAAIIQLLNGYQGTVTTPDGPVAIQAITMDESDGDRDGFDPDARLFWVQADFHVTYAE